MNARDFAHVLPPLRKKYPRYRAPAYFFVFDCLKAVISGMEEKRHVCGPELVIGVCMVAIQRFGPLARTVLGHWGIRTTDDLGEIVFALIEVGMLVKQDEDCREDFRDLLDFEDAFDHQYPWQVPDDETLRNDAWTCEYP